MAARASCDSSVVDVVVEGLKEMMVMALAVVVMLCSTASALVALDDFDLPEVMDWEAWEAVFRTGENAYATAASRARAQATFASTLERIQEHNGDAESTFRCEPV